MQINQSLKKFGFILLPLLTLVLMNLISCKEEEEGTLTCLVLGKSDIESKWVNPGHTDPSRPAELISYITFTPLPNDAMDAITVSVQGYNANGSTLGGNFGLNDGDPCPVTLPGVEYGTNSIDLSALGVFDAGGRLKPDFERIILTPVSFPEGGKNYVKFDASVDYTTGEDGMVTILPCPPCNYCRPPCRDSTDMSLQSRIDSVNLSDTIKSMDTLKKN